MLAHLKVSFPSPWKYRCFIWKISIEPFAWKCTLASGQRIDSTNLEKQTILLITCFPKLLDSDRLKARSDSLHLLNCALIHIWCDPCIISLLDLSPFWRCLNRCSWWHGVAQAVNSMSLFPRPARQSPFATNLRLLTFVKYCTMQTRNDSFVTK